MTTTPRKDGQRFTVVDLGYQLDTHRRFAVWDHTTSRFWKINGSQAWVWIEDLVQDFAAVMPAKDEQRAVAVAQRDDLVEQAFALNFDRGGF